MIITAITRTNSCLVHCLSYQRTCLHHGPRGCDCGLGLCLECLPQLGEFLLASPSLLGQDQDLRPSSVDLSLLRQLVLKCLDSVLDALDLAIYPV